MSARGAGSCGRSTTGAFAPSDPPHLMATAACCTKTVMLCRLFDGLVDGVAPSTALIPTHAIHAPCTSVSEFSPSTTGHCTQHQVASSVVAFLPTTAFVLAVLLWLWPRTVPMFMLASCRALFQTGVYLFLHTCRCARKYPASTTSEGDSRSGDDWHELRNNVADNVLLSPVQATTGAWLDSRRRAAPFAL